MQAQYCWIPAMWSYQKWPEVIEIQSLRCTIINWAQQRPGLLETWQG
jgi:hypothetical protein